MPQQLHSTSLMNAAESLVFYWYIRRTIGWNIGPLSADRRDFPEANSCITLLCILHNMLCFWLSSSSHDTVAFLALIGCIHISGTCIWCQVIYSWVVRFNSILRADVEASQPPVFLLLLNEINFWTQYGLTCMLPSTWADKRLQTPQAWQIPSGTSISNMRHLGTHTYQHLVASAD